MPKSRPNIKETSANATANPPAGEIPASGPVVLVGTYRPAQMEKWILPHGLYNYPVRDTDTVILEDAPLVSEVWLYDGKAGKHRFSAKFERRISADELDALGYPKGMGRHHGKEYLLFRVKPITDEKPPRGTPQPHIDIRLSDFAHDTKLQARLKKRFTARSAEKPTEADRKTFFDWLPDDLYEDWLGNLCVCEAAEQLDFSPLIPSFSTIQSSLANVEQTSCDMLLTEHNNGSHITLPKRTRLSKKDQFKVDSNATEHVSGSVKIPVEHYSLGDHILYHGDCRTVLEEPDFPEADLAIADPPYWKVIGQRWDYQWRTEEDYLAWSKQWLSAVYRRLRIGGTFYLFGYFRMLALLLPVLKEIGFSLRQQILVDKGMKAVAGRATKNYRMFPCVTESILFLVKDNRDFSRRLLLERQQMLHLSSKVINERLGVKANGGGMWSIYTGKNVCEQFPTRELWNRLEEILQFHYPYDKVVQTFNPLMGYSDVWTDIDFYGEKRWHPTQKPMSLIERLVKVSSNPGDLVLDPFAGSGTTLIASERLGRTARTIEIDAAYCEAIKLRFAEETAPVLALL